MISQSLKLGLFAAIASALAWLTPEFPPHVVGAALPLVPILGIGALVALALALGGGKKTIAPGKVYALKVWTPTGKNPIALQNQISGPGTRFAFDGAGRLPVLIVAKGKHDHFPNVVVDQWTVFVLNRAERELPFAPAGQDWFVEDAIEQTATTPAPVSDQLDANLSPEERAAVTNALSSPDPTDPNARLFEASQLRAFADSMLPDHPIAAAALRAKADRLAPNAPPAPAPGVAPPGVLPPPAPARTASATPRRVRAAGARAATARGPEASRARSTHESAAARTAAATAAAARRDGAGANGDRHDATDRPSRRASCALGAFDHSAGGAWRRTLDRRRRAAWRNGHDHGAHRQRLCADRVPIVERLRVGRVSHADERARGGCNRADGARDRAGCPSGDLGGPECNCARAERSQCARAAIHDRHQARCGRVRPSRHGRFAHA
jgi:hypothetical protein